MATITSKVSLHVKPTQRMQYWYTNGTLNDTGVQMVQGDVFNIADTLGHPASYVYIETEAAAGLQVRFNSEVVYYPPRNKNLNHPQHPDLENPTTWTDSTMNAITIGNGEVFILDNVMAVSDIQIVTWAGTGTGQEFEVLVH